MFRRASKMLTNMVMQTKLKHRPLAIPGHMTKILTSVPIRIESNYFRIDEQSVTHAGSGMFLAFLPVQLL